MGQGGRHDCCRCGCGYVVVRLLGDKVRAVMAGDDEVREALVVMDDWFVCGGVWVCALRFQSNKRVWASRKYLSGKLCSLRENSCEWDEKRCERKQK